MTTGGAGGRCGDAGAVVRRRLERRGGFHIAESDACCAGTSRDYRGKERHREVKQHSAQWIAIVVLVQVQQDMAMKWRCCSLDNEEHPCLANDAGEGFRGGFSSSRQASLAQNVLHLLHRDIALLGSVKG